MRETKWLLPALPFTLTQAVSIIVIKDFTVSQLLKHKQDDNMCRNNKKWML